MTKLVERALVKDLLQIARADTFEDARIDSMIELLTEDVEHYCRRKFTKADRVEYYRSYDQMFNDPDPQYVWLDGPVDTGSPFGIVWSPNMRHATAGVTLQPEDYTLDAEQGLLMISGASGLAQSLIPIGFGGRLYGYAAQGFQVAYTGGYAVTINPGIDPADPMDDFGVTQVPSGLKYVLASKISEDFQDRKKLLPFTDDQKLRLNPYRKKDIL